MPSALFPAPPAPRPPPEQTLSNAEGSDGAVPLTAFYWKECALGRRQEGAGSFWVCVEKQNMMKHFPPRLKVQPSSGLPGAEGLVCRWSWEDGGEKGTLYVCVWGGGALHRVPLLSHGSTFTCLSACNFTTRALFHWVFSVVCIVQRHPLGVGGLQAADSKEECWEGPGE